jgi:hypothetical protein
MHIDHRQVPRNLCRLVLLAALLVPCAVADPVTGEPPQEPPVTEPPEPGEPAGTAQQRPAPAPTFTPSEQIEADSAVSFPVDI